MERKLTAFIGATMALAVCATVAVVLLGGSINSKGVQAVVCFTVFAFVAQVQAFKLPHSAAGSISFLPFLSSALIAPNWVTVSAAFCSMVVSEAIRRPALEKALFNIAQLVLSIACAIIAFRLLGADGLEPSKILPGVPYLSLVTTFFVVNTGAVSGVIALSRGQRFTSVWREHAFRTLLFDVIAVFVVYSFVWVYLRVDLPGLVLLAVFVLGTRQLYSTTLELAQANQDLLQVMVAAIEMRDPYTSGHSQRVAEYSRIIARSIGLSAREVERVGVAALLHDVGKIDQRFADILQKPGRLTDEERLVIEEHPVRSAELVAMVSGLQDLVAPVRHHHERWDGGGYPDGIAGENIPLTARIIVFADTIDAMTSDRPYRPALGPEDVRRELVKHRGKQFDPYICDRLLASDLYVQIFKREAPQVETPATAAPATVAATPAPAPVIAA
ncbi:HD domain-containing phosphohydrolase [Roseisolibacter sp. H3M3-2]|uniref:HD-GYP domain-containing protein n=1 Tax=Roseisolibacter sp. H3M3-2 TaxID=3031323 RepID=UPI0023DAC5F0|nr:HD domain-containing phosphohydrolase [Roseisolibacter sp. H3M3-2]MDF1501428.1 HD domain-containing protein [Roseisolibacter sp. H3M3-2]